MSSLIEIKSKIPPATKIIAVSKKQPMTKILSLLQEGQLDFAENYVQEFLEKLGEEQLLKNRSENHSQMRWHFIGRLQRNKVKKIVGKVNLIHSVDSVELARAISEVSHDLGICQSVLLQINIANDQFKAGFDQESITGFLPQLMSFQGLEIRGFMTMPPLINSPEENRAHFRQLKSLRDSLALDFPHLKELSMGTSQDYAVAAQEGATMIRLGTVLFGARE